MCDNVNTTNQQGIRLGALLIQGGNKNMAKEIIKTAYERVKKVV